MAEKSAAVQGEHAEISTKKTLKIHKMPPTKFSKMLGEYKF